MSVPDSDLIAENMLYSQGIMKASSLSRKIIKLYKMSSEQLSKQNHYDFGLRSLKVVLGLEGFI